MKPPRPLYRIHERRLPSVIQPEKKHLHRLAAEPEPESDEANCARNALDHTRAALHCSRAPGLGKKKENGKPSLGNKKTNKTNS